MNQVKSAKIELKYVSHEDLKPYVKDLMGAVQVIDFHKESLNFIRGCPT